MKIGFFTQHINSAASDFYWNGLKYLPEVSFYNPQEDLRNYDVMLVMTYDHHVVPEIKKLSPKTKVGLIDPRNYKVTESAKKADFLIVDSIEMQDYWSKLEKPIHRYVEYPNFPSISKTHKEKKKIRMGYHGNQIHLRSMSNAITPAISELGKKYDLELMVMYSGTAPRKEETWWPDNVSVIHVPWGHENYSKHLSTCDIGLSPNRLPITEAVELANKENKYNLCSDDYVLRFKMPTNPGRIIVFGKLGIPVVADFYPSAFETLHEGRGFVCHSKSAWKNALESLILSHELRQTMSDSLQNYIQDKFNFEHQNACFLYFLRNM